MAAFNPTRTLGFGTKVLLDEDAGRFLVATNKQWRNTNPDVLDFSQVTGCDTEIRETKTELHWTIPTARSTTTSLHVTTSTTTCTSPST